MMDAPDPPKWLLDLLAERTAPISLDAQLDRQRRALLDAARKMRQSSPADLNCPAQGQRAALKWALGEMEAFYARGTAESIETMVGLIDAIPDPPWRLKAMATPLAW
jgi:hypothetical protein